MLYTTVLRQDLRPVMLAACLAGLGLGAQAGRPLGTEDAGTNPPTQCQLEAWVDSAADGSRTAHVGPACGVIDGLELGLEWVHATPRRAQTQGRALALKWAPEWLAWQDWRLGLKAATTEERASDSPRWHQASLTALAMASLPINQAWALHLNLGHERDDPAAEHHTTYGAALVWTPHERWTGFAELTGKHRTPATQAIGLRWWALPQQLGLDLTASHRTAAPRSDAWGVGIGWYGIRF